MKNIVFYFSGTGNNLSLARDIAQAMGDTEVAAIRDWMEKTSADLPYERIGFVFPVYFACLPAIVRRFVEKLSFDKEQYVFGVATYGAAAGTSLAQLQRAVAVRGGVLRAGFGLAMPGDYIVKYGAYPAALQRVEIRNAAKKAKRIAETVNAKADVQIPAGSAIMRRIEQDNLKLLDNTKNLGTQYRATDACTGCQMCEKLCPVGNIQFSDADKRPHWGNACEQCVACIQWCPARAIEWGDKTAKRKRYHHPDVKAADLLPQ